MNASSVISGRFRKKQICLNIISSCPSICGLYCFSMIDEIAIQQTLNRYTEGASRADWPQVMSTFTADAIWEIPALGARYQQHAVIQQAMAAFIGQMAYF